MNKLSSETSPYLLQHQNNPVDWFPWGKEALDKASIENKIIILSIGYSACHWCHVMEHECFEDHEVAEVMNRNFVSIKVDREERPDIDAIYMDAIQAMGLHGGWPLNVFLLPNQKPFYGGTYFPKAKWILLLQSIQNAFVNENDKVVATAESYTERINLKESEKYDFYDAANQVKLDENDLHLIANKLSAQFDIYKGGMLNPPKFPMPAIWNTVLSLSTEIDARKLDKQLKLTLDKLILSGIFDHISGGWARYATDDNWMIPHFEKMLYDNGQLLSLLANTIYYNANNSEFTSSLEFYKSAVLKTINWLKQDMLAPNGGFYSALDADSEGEEGKFYIWQNSEINAILGADADWFCEIYQISEEGNWEHGNNILHLEAFEQNVDRLEKCLIKLLEIRNKRIRPGLDNKQICGWNALTLSGILNCAKVLNNPLLEELIVKNLNFIENNLLSRHDFSLKHQFGKENLGFLDDYAAVIEAFIGVYEYNFDECVLFRAKEIIDYVIANFLDEDEGLFYFSDKNDETLIARKKEIFDNVIPSSNAMMAKNLYFLGRYFDDQKYSNLAERMFSKIKLMALKEPRWLSLWANLGVLMSIPEIEITIIGDEAYQFAKEIKNEFRKQNVIILASNNVNSKLPAFIGRDKIENSTLIYICENKTCSLPLENVENAIKLLNSF